MAQTLISTQDVMDFGNLDNDALKPRIASLLASVFAAAEQDCLRKFSSDTFTEYFDADGSTSSYLVANPPMTALVSVTDDVQYSARSIDTSTNVLFYTEQKEEGLVQLYKNEGRFSGGVAGVRIIYTGGWTATTMPAELKEAICQEVLFRLNVRAVGVKQENADGAGTTYATERGFAKEVADTLLRYRAWWKGIG